MKKHSVTIQYNAPVTLTFSLLSLLALLLGTLTHGWTAQNLFVVFRSPLSDFLTYPRLFLHVLGHQDFAACAANIVMILVVGPAAEERFSSRRVLLAIVLTALVTSLVLWFLFPAGTSLRGASGVVFMLIVLSAFSGARGGVIPLTLILVLILYLGTEIAQAVTGSAGLVQLTHIAGGVVGVVLGMLYIQRGR